MRSPINVQIVLRGDNQTPAGPDSSGSRQGTILSQRQLLGGAAKIGDTGDDQSPLSKVSYIHRYP